ncbi:hypothetical protein CCMA1212_009518 [Trichoderma ghanense]|uniref:Uncharacterized protein n=1 Tax=Trichoderma ghanense TaxID=65468 RepID=A0ABY2GT09_9HYPO
MEMEMEMEMRMRMRMQMQMETRDGNCTGETRFDEATAHGGGGGLAQLIGGLRSEAAQGKTNATSRTACGSQEAQDGIATEFDTVPRMGILMVQR